MRATIEIDLKDPRLAAFLAWLVPGLGHLYQGRTGKGVLFFVCIVGTFVYGMYIGQGRVVYASTADVFSREFLERWQYICQVGVGLPALPALVQRERIQDGKAPLIADNFMRPPYKFPPQGSQRLHLARRCQTTRSIIRTSWPSGTTIWATCLNWAPCSR